MENKINVAELLKDSPSGMELNCTMYEDVYFDYIDELCNIYCYIKNEDFRTSIMFNRHGRPIGNVKSKCVIFPKGKTTWEGFHRPFVEGKANGYKWNPETKTLEKLIEPKFKVGDRIRNKISLSYYTIVDIKNDQYFIKPDDAEKFPYHVPFSYETNYELVPNKFNIATLKPFDKVLVRDGDKQEWYISFFDSCNGLEIYKYSCINGVRYSQCIPYEGNEYLRGKTDDCDEYYKTWREWE